MHTQREKGRERGRAKLKDEERKKTKQSNQNTKTSFLHPKNHRTKLYGFPIPLSNNIFSVFCFPPFFFLGKIAFIKPVENEAFWFHLVHFQMETSFER